MACLMKDFDLAVIGAGIVGLAATNEICSRQPELRIALLDKESEVARHQSGRNSGVLHTGVYYRPGSRKARACVLGRSKMVAFCQQHGIAHDITGKVIVATEPEQQPALQQLRKRAAQNGVSAATIDRKELREIEPHARGVGALHVPQAGIVDYRAVCAALLRLCRARGVEFYPSTRVVGFRQQQRSLVIDTSQQNFRAKFVLNCGGLYSDRLAHLCGAPSIAQIVPFRGHYYHLAGPARDWVRGLIYPVPLAGLPFLGVHLTRDLHGGVHVGPNAVLAAGREAYHRWAIDWEDLAETLTYPGFVQLAARYGRLGGRELLQSLSRRAFAREAALLLPQLRARHLLAAPSGIRAQAVLRDGRLVDDFLFHQVSRSLSVINAPSPAATASLELAREIADRTLDGLAALD